MVFQKTRDLVRPWIPVTALEWKRRLLRRHDLNRSLNLVRRFGPAATGDEAWRMASEYRGWGEFETLRAVQVKSEACQLLDMLREENVVFACEIGSFMGGMLFMMSRVLPDHAQIFSIDWPEAPGTLERFPPSRKHLYERFALANQKISVIHGNSQDRGTIAALSSALKGNRLDYLMIDADHSIEGVRADFLNYSSFVKPGGLIAFHDILGDESRTEELFRYRFGVAQFWNSIRNHYEHREFIDPECYERRLGGGIGVLLWKGTVLGID
jgi:predicted O-methyltransferase YrrM